MHLALTGHNYSTFVSVEENALKNETRDIASINLALQTWKIGAICSRTEKRSYAANVIKDAYIAAASYEVRIELSDLGLTNIPNAPFACPLFIANLKQFTLSKNALSTFPASVTLLSNLEGLNLAGNRLKEVPAAIRNLKKLSQLALSGNQLEEIPEEIG